MSKKNLVLLLLPIGLAAALAGYMVSRHLAGGTSPSLDSGTALPAPRALAPFALTDHLGRPFGNAELTGNASLVFFGFTHCPDVCPTTLALMTRLQSEPALAGLRLVFVTVDPKRDDPAAVKRYVEAFGTGITGITGPDAALEPLFSSLGVVRAIQPLAGADYTVDHSATLYYINADGKFAAVFTPPFDVAAMRTDLTALLAASH